MKTVQYHCGWNDHRSQITYGRSDITDITDHRGEDNEDALDEDSGSLWVEWSQITDHIYVTYHRSQFTDHRWLQRGCTWWRQCNITVGGSGLGLALAESGWVERGACLSYFILRFLQRGCYFILYTGGATLYRTIGGSCVCCFILCFLQRGCYFIIRFLLGGALYFLRHFILYFFTANIGVSGYLCATLHSASYKGCHFILYFLIWLSTS